MDVKLYINGKDAYKEWGITLVNSSSLSALMTPPGKKERTSNDSKSEDGQRYIADTKLRQRDVSLPLQFSAASEEEFLKRYKSFCKMLEESEWLNIYTSYDSDTLYKFLYDSCTQFAQYNLGIAKFTLKLIEPNPTDRANTYTAQ